VGGPGTPEDQPVVRVLFGDLKPGETPIDDFSGLKVRGISTLRELDFHEAINISNAIVDYLRQGERKRIDFDLEGVKSVHKDMFCDVWDWAGEFRNRDLNLGCHWANIQEKLYVLLEDLKVWDRYSHDLIEQASWLHHRSVQIHPFPNGNGRWSRMLANIWLLERQVGIVEWPNAMGETSPVRGEYVEAIRAADKGDYAPLVQLHRQFIPPPPRPVMAQPDRPPIFGPGTVIQLSAGPPLPPTDE
jgi:Fic-DOC domain mobile mystery protein B